MEAIGRTGGENKAKAFQKKLKTMENVRAGKERKAVEDHIKELAEANKNEKRGLVNISSVFAGPDVEKEPFGKRKSMPNGKMVKEKPKEKPKEVQEEETVVRRKSSRICEKEQEDGQLAFLGKVIRESRNETENYLVQYRDPIKNRAIRAAKDFAKNEFIVEYKGEIITNKEHLEREAKRDYDNSYVMSFRNRDDGDKLYWVDADDEALWGGTMGRLINHSRRAPNSEKKYLLLPGAKSPNIILVAIKDIKKGQEILYDYGEKRPHVLELNPWIENS